MKFGHLPKEPPDPLVLQFLLRPPYSSSLSGLPEGKGHQTAAEETAQGSSRMESLFTTTWTLHKMACPCEKYRQKRKFDFYHLSSELALKQMLCHFIMTFFFFFL